MVYLEVVANQFNDQMNFRRNYENLFTRVRENETGLKAAQEDHREHCNDPEMVPGDPAATQICFIQIFCYNAAVILEDVRRSKRFLKIATGEGSCSNPVYLAHVYGPAVVPKVAQRSDCTAGKSSWTSGQSSIQTVL